MKIKSRFKSLRYVKDTGWFISETPVSEYNHYDDVAIDPHSDYEVFDAHIFDGLPTPTESALFSLVDGQIAIPPVTGLPTNLTMDWQWAAMHKDGTWSVFNSKPCISIISWVAYGGDASYIGGLFQTHTDPQGWRNSLHKRQPDGTWQRADFSEISEN
jgi:hypothetical protein